MENRPDTRTSENLLLWPELRDGRDNDNSDRRYIVAPKAVASFSQEEAQKSSVGQQVDGLVAELAEEQVQREAQIAGLPYSHRLIQRKDVVSLCAVRKVKP